LHLGDLLGERHCPAELVQLADARHALGETSGYPLLGRCRRIFEPAAPSGRLDRASNGGVKRVTRDGHSGERAQHEEKVILGRLKQDSCERVRHI